MCLDLSLLPHRDGVLDVVQGLEVVHDLFHLILHDLHQELEDVVEVRLDVLLHVPVLEGPLALFK